MTGLGSRAIRHAEHPDMRRSSSSYLGRIAVQNGGYLRGDVDQR
jgi:hypothetical protein